MLTEYATTKKIYAFVTVICLVILFFSDQQPDSESNESERACPVFVGTKQHCGADPYLRKAPRKLIYEPHELNEYKKILIWNEFFSGYDFRFGMGMEPFERNKCKVQKCFLTNDRKQFQNYEFAAVLRFFDPWIYDRHRQPPLPVLSNNTMNVFVMLEYPATMKTYHRNSFTDNYNWTYTYRTDSDFRIPYGIMEEIDKDAQIPSTTTNFAEGKTKLATWIVSHCHPVFSRQLYVNTLKKHMPVDVYGKCGNLTCPKFDIEGCVTNIYKKYKFLLAFENSVCKDYITEKTFRTIMSNIIPVGFGLGYDKLGLPEKSYIDAFAFESVRHMADYLKYLDSNDTAYNEYFAWKENYRVKGKWLLHRRTMCDLCASLHQMDPKSPYGKDIDVTKEVTAGFPVTSTTLNTRTTARIASQHPNFQRQYTNVFDWVVRRAECLDHKRNQAFKEFLQGATKTELRTIYGIKGPTFYFINKPNLQWP